jgi:hypothetical protein
MAHANHDAISITNSSVHSHFPEDMASSSEARKNRGVDEQRLKTASSTRAQLRCERTHRDTFRPLAIQQYNHESRWAAIQHPHSENMCKPAAIGLERAASSQSQRWIQADRLSNTGTHFLRRLRPQRTLSRCLKSLPMFWPAQEDNTTSRCTSVVNAWPQTLTAQRQEIQLLEPPNSQQRCARH